MAFDINKVTLRGCCALFITDTHYLVGIGISITCPCELCYKKGIPMQNLYTLYINTVYLYYT